MNIALCFYFFLCLAGIGFLCSGAFILFGLGWALIAGALSCFAVAAFIRKGLTSE